jgi:hypothetical protein
MYIILLSIFIYSIQVSYGALIADKNVIVNFNHNSLGKSPISLEDTSGVAPNQKISNLILKNNFSTVQKILITTEFIVKKPANKKYYFLAPNESTTIEFPDGDKVLRITAYLIDPAGPDKIIYEKSKQQ